MILIEDRKLLDGYRAGEQAALLAVYRHYVRDVTRFLARGFTFNSRGRPFAFRGFSGGYESEAAVQEVFRKVFEENARLAYDGLSPFRPYLLRIARNLVINDLKAKQPILFKYRQGRAVTLSEPSEAELALENTPIADRSQDDLLEAQEVAQLVAEFKKSLSARELGVFEQRFEHGHSALDAAQALGLGRSQVRTTEGRVRGSFLKYMQRSGYLQNYTANGPSAVEALGTVALLLGWGLTA